MQQPLPCCSRRPEPWPWASSCSCRGSDRGEQGNSYIQPVSSGRSPGGLFRGGPGCRKRALVKENRMLDREMLRNEADKVREAAESKNEPCPIDEWLRTDSRRRVMLQDLEDLRRRK